MATVTVPRHLLTDKYAAMLTPSHDAIDVLDETMPITVIREWEVSIRPCEFDNQNHPPGVPAGWLPQIAGRSLRTRKGHFRRA